MKTCPSGTENAEPTFNEKFNGSVWCVYCGKYFSLAENTKVIGNEESGIKIARFYFPTHEAKAGQD